MTRVLTLGGYPIEQYGSPNAGGRMNSHRGSVLHIAEGTYHGTIGWQLNGDQRYRDGTQVTTCSTWIVGREEGEWAQMVDSDQIAWCQRAGSLDWLSIELAGWAPQPPTKWQVWAAAQLLAWDHRTYGTPLAVADHPGQRGLGHHSMDREWLGEEWGHEACPGAGVIAAKPTIVDLATTIEGGEDMPYTQWPAKDRQALVDDVATAVAKRPNASNEVALGTMIRRLYDQRGTGLETLAVLAELTGQISALTTLVQQVQAAPATLQLTAEQTQELADAVTAGGQAAAAQVLARLHAAGLALAPQEGEEV